MVLGCSPEKEKWTRAHSCLWGWQGTWGNLRQLLLASPQAHLLHTAPGHRGEGVGHQSGAQTSEEPYLPIHLHDVLGYKKTGGAVSRPAQTYPLWVTFTPRPDAACPSATEGAAIYPKLQKQSGPNPEVFLFIFDQQIHIF